ncbi:hypothetical protein BC567DRAFT_233065 [Phyllosticta citribraziliensis]
MSIRLSAPRIVQVHWPLMQCGEPWSRKLSTASRSGFWSMLAAIAQWSPGSGEGITALARSLRFRSTRHLCYTLNATNSRSTPCSTPRHNVVERLRATRIQGRESRATKSAFCRRVRPIGAVSYSHVVVDQQAQMRPDHQLAGDRLTARETERFPEALSRRTAVPGF